MTKRRSITSAQMRDMLIAQAAAASMAIPCALCSNPLLPGQRFVREHMHALGLGGADSPENEALVHFECADRKTRGTKATTYGSDVHAIAKGKRLRGETGQGKRKRQVPQDRRSWAEKWPNHKRLPDGKVVPR